MDMLHQIGDKKLQNVAVVKLCATEMYDFYLTNYGFDPCEKEDYSGMVAEDVGNSCNHCGQIADAAIEIEKIIEELSEQELQDETVLRGQ